MPALLQSLQSRTAFRLHSVRVTLLAVLFCAASSLWATPVLTKFNGVVSTLNTGTVTLSGPDGVAVDLAGDVYIADVGTNKVSKVSANGAAATLDLSAVGALSSPSALALDAAGTLYIADTGNNRIIKYDTAGNASVVNLGSLSLSNPQGLALDTAGTLYIADSSNDRIIKLAAGGSAAVFALTGLSTQIGFSVGLCTDALGNLYIGDIGNHRVVKASAAGAASVVVIGNSLPSDFAPYSLAVDTLGNLFIADTNDSGLVATVSPTGVTTLRNFGSTAVYPYAIAVDAAGTLYVADDLHHQVVTQAASTVNFGHVQYGATTGTAITLPFTIAAADTLATVQALTVGAANLDFTVVSSGTTCTTGASSTTCNVNVQFLPTAPGLRRGAVVLTFDNLTLTVPVFGFSDAPMATFNPGAASTMNVGTSTLSYPFQAALDGAGNMYVANYGSSGNVIKFPAGGGTGTIVSTGAATLTNPIGVAVDGAGNLFIAGYTDSKVVKVPVSGAPSYLTITGLGSYPLSFPTALAFDVAGNLYIADDYDGRIVKVTPTGAGSVVSVGSYTVYETTGVAVDQYGTVYLSDYDNSHIIKVTAAGVVSLVVPAGITPALSSPYGVAVDGMGNLYILDGGGSRIIEVTTAGVASVLKTPGLTGPPAVSTVFGLTVDPSGNLIIPDFGNSRIVNLNLAAGNLAYTSTAVGSTSTDSPKVATVTNIGNLSLVFAADPTYPVDFVVNTGDTSLCAAASPLLAGTACDVAAKFIPLSRGALSESVSLTDNALNVTGSAQQVNVSGTGIQVDTTAVTVTGTPAIVSIGQPIAIAVAVTDSTAPGTVPTGYVTLSDVVGSTAISLTTGSGIALSGGAATMSNTVLVGAGTHTITANYTGVSGSFLTSTSTTTVTVNLDTSAVALTATPTPVTIGQPIALAALVTDTTAPGTIPTGYVTLSDTVGGTTTSLTSGPGLALSGTGAASMSNVVLSGAGTHTITANYTGVNGRVLTSTSTATVTVNLATATPTGPAAQPVQVVHGQAGSIAVSFPAVAGLPGPSGTVTYTIVNAANGAVASGTFTLAGGDGPASITIPVANTLASGPYTVHVSYGGSAYYAASTLAIQLQIGPSTPVVTFATPPPIPYGTALGSGILTATAAYNGASAPGSFAFTATPTGGAAATVTAATILPAGGYTLTATFTPTDATLYTTATAQATLMVNKAAPLASLAASVSTLNPGQSVTLTSVVTSMTTGTPTGSVSFYDGTQLLGTVTVTSGQAVFIATGLLSGVHSLTAVYSGDANFTGVTGGGTGLTVTVSPLEFTLTSTQTGTPSVLPGAVVNYNLSITPTYGSFPGAVTFAVTGLPAGATWTMNPASLPASSTGGPLALAVQTAAPSATASLRSHTGQLLWALLALPLAGARRLRRMRGRLRGAGLLMLLLLGSAAVLGLSGCGATIGIFGPSPQTYNLTVTATSGAIQHSVNVSMNIQ